MDPILQNSVLNCNIPWPEVSYSKISRRNDIIPDSSNILELIQRLDGYKDHPVVAIDGQNGTTKSTFCNSLRRMYIKVNNLAPDITQGPTYNVSILRSIEYLLLQLKTTATDSIWDRCPYSNIIFYYVHYLMSKFKDTPIPASSESVWPIFAILAQNTNLSDTLHFCKTISNIPTIFFVCRDINYISRSMQRRAVETNSVTDLWNCKEFNYQMAQYHAYVWFGKLLDYPVFDLRDFFDNGFSINEMHVIIASKLDKTPKNPTCTVPDRCHSQQLIDKIEQLGDDILIYNQSRK